MKRLAVLRHAKSSWAQPGSSDESRKLNQRGLEQVRQLANWLNQEGFIPDIVYCSPAVRTRETCEGLMQSLGNPTVEIHPTLYNSDLDCYLDSLWATHNAETVLLIAHNPTCDDLVRYMTAPSSPAAESLMSYHFSSATFALLELGDIEWSNLRAGQGRLVQFMRPKDIQSLGDRD